MIDGPTLRQVRRRDHYDSEPSLHRAPDCCRKVRPQSPFDRAVRYNLTDPLTSYDNSVRLFDVRKPLVPLTQADVGGGAWRVKWHPYPSRKNDLLVACMHDGFKVVRFGGLGDSSAVNDASAGTWEIVKRFDEHESLAYGVDWSFAEPNGDGDTLVASCSFYDHTLRLWRG